MCMRARGMKGSWCSGQGMEFVPLAVGVRSPNHGATGEFLQGGIPVEENIQKVLSEADSPSTS